jgi:hypothetical protein
MNKYSGRMKAIEAQGARTALTSLPQGKEVVTKQAALKGANINAKRASHYEAMAAHPETKISPLSQYIFLRYPAGGRLRWFWL